MLAHTHILLNKYHERSLLNSHGLESIPFMRRTSPCNGDFHLWMSSLAHGDTLDKDSFPL